MPTPAPSPKPSDKGNLKERVKKKHLQAFGRALANLASKAAAALPGIIGYIVSWLLNTLGKTATWLAENLWAMAIAVGILLLVAARDWLTPPQPKRHKTECDSTGNKGYFFFFMGLCLYLLQRLRTQLRCMLGRNMGDFLSMRRRTLWPPLNSPCRWGDSSFECAVAWSLWRFRLVYSGVVANNCVRSGYDNLVIVALYIAWGECHIAR